MSAVKFAILFSRILRHSRNSRKFSPAKITESTVFLCSTSFRSVNQSNKSIINFNTSLSENTIF